VSDSEPGTKVEEDEDERTPFDNPFFLPAILIGFALWLGYDGWLNAEFIEAKLAADESWKIDFNRWGAVICALFGGWFSVRAVRERKASD
jgi:ABC-type sulfate transport system permease component